MEQLGGSIGSSSLAAKALVMVIVAFIYLVQRLIRPKGERACTSTTSTRSVTCSSVPVLPPGPVPWPVVGNLPKMILNKPSFRWIDLIMKEMGTDIACIRLGGVHVVPITCPKIAREVLRKQDGNFASRPLTFASGTFSGGYKNAVLSPFGEQWTKMRRVLTSEIICPSRHRWLDGQRADEADNLTRYVYNLCASAMSPSSSSSPSSSGGPVDVRHVARHYCGNVIRRLVFGRRYFGSPRSDGGPGQMEVDHMEAVFTSLGLLFAFCVSDYLPWLRGFDVNGHEKMVKEANARVNKLHDTVIDERWMQWKAGDREVVEDFLDLLITLKKKDGEANPLLTIEEVKAQSQDITFAAVDNPSNAVEWALAEMANAPEVMAKAVEEMDRVVGRDRLVQESDLPRLNYGKACLREAFRLHPVAPFNVPHVALEATTVAGYHIPKGSHVILSRTGLGRNPAVWDDPLRFNPERHVTHSNSSVALTENELRFISFSTGRRGCVAATLGTAMCMMLFGRLLQGFNWSMPAGVSEIDLTESTHDLFLAKPLVLHAQPRLSAHLYSPAAI